MDYFSLKCFLEVVRTGSFSKASQKLFRTQPAVSLQIKKLEDELGVQLIDRYKRNITLTDQGKLFYEHAEELVDKTDYLKRILSESIGEPRGIITIATNLSLLNHLLPNILNRYHKKYPKVQITLLNLTSKQIVNAILEGKADVGIGFQMDRYPGIAFQKIKDTSFCLVCQKKHLYAEKDRISSKDILEGDLVHFETGVDLRCYIEKNLKAEKELNPIMELPSIESILTYINQGFGYSVLPEFSLSNYWQNRLAVRKIDYLIPPMAICIYYHQKRIAPRIVKLFFSEWDNQRKIKGSTLQM